jgi:hypothetical protein
MRAEFKTRRIRLIGPVQVSAAQSLLGNVPIDQKKPIECVIREEPTIRSLDQNARMWAGPLRDIADQAWLSGRQFNDELWHEHFKKEFLPDENKLSPDELALRVKDPENYRKFGVDPGGDRVCIGSTTQLTKFGFGEYLTQIEAVGAELGVQFSASPNE